MTTLVNAEMQNWVKWSNIDWEKHWDKPKLSKHLNK